MSRSAALSSVLSFCGLCLLASAPAMADPANPPARFRAPAADGSLGAAILTASVNTDGTLLGGSGATGADIISSFTGNYEVFFTRDVTGCTYSVAPFTLKFFWDVQPRSGSPNGVFVHFQDPSGTDTNVRFYLTVNCGQ